MINELISKLEDLGYPVAYGAATSSEIKASDPWNYFVVTRTKTVIKSTSKYYEFTVNFIHEEYIPEGYEETIISKVQEIKNMRLRKDESIDFAYSKKGNTNTALEIIMIPFKGMISKCPQ